MKKQRQFIMRLSLITTVCILIVSFTSVEAQTINTNETGIHDGYYYSFWNAGGGTVTMTLGAGGNYSMSWTSCNNFTAGKGWSEGGRKNVSFSGTFNGGSNGYLAVYGWTTDPLVEYYIVENYGSWTPPGGTSIGTVKSDGGTYNIYKIDRTNAPSILGNNTDFTQYWSVRTSRRSTGTVHTGIHFDAWSNLGMDMGTFNYMILETEGYKSTGSSNMTVGEADPAGLAVNEDAGTDDFVVYPNPVKDIVTIGISRNIESSSLGAIYSVNGSLLKKFNLSTGLNLIDVKDLQTGVYFIRMNVNNEIISRKIVK